MIKNSFQQTFAFILISTLFLISVNAFGQVGINTTSPTTVLDVNGAISLRESPRDLELVAGSNEINFGANLYSNYRIRGPIGPFSIRAITPVNAGDGQVVRLINTTTQVMTIVNFSGIGLGNTEILCPGATDLILAGKNSSVTLQYSKELRKWTVLGYAIRNGPNKYFVKTPNTGSAENKNNNDWSDLKDMSLTFTPVNSFVLVSYSVAGDVINGPLERTTGKFRLVMNSNEILRTSTRSPSLNNKEFYHNFLPLYVISVTPGIPVTIKIQWAREGNGTIHNNPQYVEHERYLRIID